MAERFSRRHRPCVKVPTTTLISVIRRSFRFGLTLGLLGGIAFALVKMREARQAAGAGALPASGEPWPPLVPDPAAQPLTSSQRLVPDPIAPAAPAERPAAPVAPAGEAPTAEARPTAPAHMAPAEQVDPPTTTPPQQAPAKKAPAKKGPAKKAAAKKKAPVRALWVEPKDGVCPTTHPVKGKLASKIFHLPGMLNYERTRPDRCYRDPQAAEDDGLRSAKR